MPPRQIILDASDEALAVAAHAAIANAIAKANKPEAVAGRIRVIAQGYRNKGRTPAMKRTPFKGICEASGKPIDKSIAALDELEPDKGYNGKLRWVCARRNNSGSGTCGVC